MSAALAIATDPVFPSLRLRVPANAAAWVLACASAAALGLAISTAAHAGDAPAARDGAHDALPDARSDSAWLQSIQDAARHQTYVGTIVYQNGEEVHASRVVQSYDGEETRERVLTLDGQKREFIRHGDEVQCLYPDLHRIVVEHRGEHAFPAFANRLPTDLLTHYEVKREGNERVAGMPCDVVELVPRDKMRYGYRLCVDSVSGLLFKAQTLNERGTVLEQVAFTDIHVGEKIDPAQLKPSWPTDGWTVEKQTSQATQLSQQGWSVTPPTGFHRLAEMVRHLIGKGESSPRPALQAVYSDGLATVSVFIEPGAPMIGEAEESMRHGPMTAFSRQVGDARVTVVGEVPPATAQSIAQSVVHSSAEK